MDSRNDLKEVADDEKLVALVLLMGRNDERLLSFMCAFRTCSKGIGGYSWR